MLKSRVELCLQKNRLAFFMYLLLSALGRLDDAIAQFSEAVPLPSRTCDLSGGTNGPLLASLAAACAEAGRRFEDAANTAGRVRDRALASGDRWAVSAARERIMLDESTETYRQQ